MITRVLPTVPSSAATLKDNWDDEDGYYRIVLGEVVDDGRYHVFSHLGKGMFSAVVRARVMKPDPRTGEVVGDEVEGTTVEEGAEPASVVPGASEVVCVSVEA